MKHKQGTGSLNCRMCGASFQMPIHHLHEPIDVFSEWLDECEAAEKRKNGIDVVGGGSAIGANDALAAQGGGGGAAGRREYEYDSEEDELPGTSGVSGDKTNSKSAQPQQHSLAALGVGDSDDDSE